MGWGGGGSVPGPAPLDAIPLLCRLSVMLPSGIGRRLRSCGGFRLRLDRGIVHGRSFIRSDIRIVVIGDARFARFLVGDVACRALRLVQRPLEHLGEVGVLRMALPRRRVGAGVAGRRELGEANVHKICHGPRLSTVNDSKPRARFRAKV